MGVCPPVCVTFTVDSSAKGIRQLTVATYLDEQDKDASGFLELPDVTRYAASKVLNVAANEIVVQIEDRNYRKLAP